MNDRLAYINWYPMEGSALQCYIRRVQPPLRPAELRATIYANQARSVLRTPTDGDTTVAIHYKKREGFILGMGTQAEDLRVLQVQGGCQEGYRVMTGLDCLHFSADQLLRIGEHPSSPFRRITMPNTWNVNGIGDASNNAHLNYSALAHRVGLVYSSEEQQYVRDLPKRKRK